MGIFFQNVRTIQIFFFFPAVTLYSMSNFSTELDIDDALFTHDVSLIFPLRKNPQVRFATSKFFLFVLVGPKAICSL